MSTVNTSNGVVRKLSVNRGVGSTAACTMQQTDYTGTFNVTDTVTRGANYPDWRERIARGDSATTGQYGTKYSYSFARLSYSQEMKPTSPYYASLGCTSRVQASGQNLGSLPTGSVSTIAASEAERSARSALLRSLTQAQTAWRGSNFIAEFAETVKLLRSPLEGIHKSTWKMIRKVDSMKRLFRRDPRRYAQLLGNTWLTWSWGVKPLLNDVAELGQAIQNMSNDLSSRDMLPIRGNGVAPVTQSVLFTGWSVPYLPFAVYDAFNRTESSVRYKGAVRATPPGFQAVLQNFGFTPEDILPAVWEAIPWSALVDYFINVNEKIESLRWATADVAWLQRSMRNTSLSWTPGIKRSIHPDIVHYNVTARGGAAWARRTYIERYATLAPYPYWDFKIPNSLEQWINIAALWAGIVASKPPLYGPQPGD